MAQQRGQGLAQASVCGRWGCTGLGSIPRVGLPSLFADVIIFTHISLCVYVCVQSCLWFVTDLALSPAGSRPGEFWGQGVCDAHRLGRIGCGMNQG